MIEVYKRDVDLTLIRQNLKKTPEERVIGLIELHRVWTELRRAGDEARRRGRRGDP